MWEGHYGKEPFDLRLTVLRMVRRLPQILAVTLAGTLLFGGGYTLKNVWLDREREYAHTSTYKIEYVEEPAQSGDYYINEMSWNTYVKSGAFLTAVKERLAEDSMLAEDSLLEEGMVTQASGEGQQIESSDADMEIEELAAMISAKLPSDWHVPTVTVVTDDPFQSMLIARAVEAVMTQQFTEIATELKQVTLIDSDAEATEVLPDVRPVRAFVLSAILSLFFAVLVIWLTEVTADSIWLPVTLRSRYGLAAVGTIESRELLENLAYRFQGKQNVALCAADADCNPVQALEALQHRLASGKAELRELQWTALPTPLLEPETAEHLREIDGVLLLVRAGQHTGKPLEYLLEYFAEQEIPVTAALLWEADEKLIRAYYFLHEDRQTAPAAE